MKSIYRDNLATINKLEAVDNPIVICLLVFQVQENLPWLI